MSGGAGPEVRADTGSALAPLLDVIAPLIDVTVPRELARAAGRARNLALLGAGLPWLLPRSASLATADLSSVIRGSAAFAVAAVAAHVVRRRERGALVAVGACVAAAVVAGYPARAAWPFVLGAVIVATLVLAQLRSRSGASFAAPDPPAPWIGNLAWGFATALVFREFAALPMHVPTGSMEPTIHAARPGASGDFLAVDRNAYLFRDPQRWDVAVFDFPLHRSTEFVKRIVALPGETIEIRDGDLWIDDRIARKPPLLQETMWRETFPRPGPLAEPHKVPQDWTAADRSTGGGWAIDGDRVRCTPPAAAKESVLKFTRRLDQGDVRVRCVAEPSPGAGVALRVTSRGRRVTFSLRTGPDAAGVQGLDVDGVPAAANEAVFLKRPASIELAVADGEAVARIDAVEVWRAEVPPGTSRQHGVEIAVRGGPVTFRDLRVDLDQQWIPAADGTTTWKVPPDSFFVLGDNARQSEDSRAWTVSEVAVRGRDRPLRFPLQYPDDRGAPRPNVRRDGEHLVFEDTDGVLRRVPRGDVEVRRDGIAAPFVPRDHLLGRAGFVFWSFELGSQGSEWFRPRFLR